MTTKKHKENESTIDMEQVRMLWALGDWSALTLLLANSAAEQQPEVTAYLVCALLQQGNSEQARELLAQTNTSKQLLARLLIAGTYNSLAKAAACNYNHNKARQLFASAVNTGLAYKSSEVLQQSRVQSQYAQLNLPHIIAKPLAEKPSLPDLKQFLAAATSWFPEEPSLQIALADYHQRQRQFDQAIVHWQQVSSMLDQDTPQAYYDRLKDAYKMGKSFPLGTVEQETLKGDIDKHKLLAEIHKQLNPEFYFEIGVQTGKSLALAKCEAIGVDPMPLVSVPLAANAKVITASSDAFFEQKSDLLLNKSIDLAFIDGMHLFEYALRDFINVERFAKPYTLVVIDDILPGHPDQAKRDRCTRAWTGDVWKLREVLEQYRPDLQLLTVDAYPTGLLLISGLNPENNVLQEKYAAIVDEYLPQDKVPEHFVTRSNVESGKSAKITDLISMLKEAKLQFV